MGGTNVMRGGAGSEGAEDGDRDASWRIEVAQVGLVKVDSGDEVCEAGQLGVAGSAGGCKDDRVNQSTGDTL